MYHTTTTKNVPNYQKKPKWHRPDDAYSFEVEHIIRVRIFSWISKKAARRVRSVYHNLVFLCTILSLHLTVAAGLSLRVPHFHAVPRIKQTSLLYASSSIQTTDVPEASSQKLGEDGVTLQKWNSSSSISPPSLEGLSKFHLSILSRTAERQRFVTGKYPVIVSVKDHSPTRKWLNLGREFLAAETQVLVNNTSPSRCLASLDRFQWLDDAERETLREQYSMVSLEFLAEINLERPGYLQILDSSGAGSSAIAATVDMKEKGSWNVKAEKLLRQLDLARSTRTTTNLPVTSSSSLLNHYRSSLNTDRLWVTGFSLAGRQGLLTFVDCESCHIGAVNLQSRRSMQWPNEVQQVPAEIVRKHPSDDMYQRKSEQKWQDALLVCDGFLVPTKDRGGIYVTRNPAHEMETTICLTNQRDRWFYHKAIWLDLTGDGRQSILSARCKVSTILGNRKSGDGIVTSGITKTGELVWLECPKPHSFSEAGTPLEENGTVFDPFNSKHLPWKTRVLANGPDVMFSIADLDPEDDNIEVIASQFFKKRVTLHSIRRGPKPKVTFQKNIDKQCGQAFGAVLANLDCSGPESKRNRGEVVDCGSTVVCLKPGDSFSHVLVTSHECSYAAEDNSETAILSSTGSRKERISSLDGGSLFAYRVPIGKGAWKTEPWIRSTIASGFKVQGQLSNMINPGAPGFVYTFFAKRDDDHRSKRPLIAVAGDCAESAYIFRPACSHESTSSRLDTNTHYKLMAELQCGATVGSIGIGYDDFSSVEQESGYAKLYIPCYERDKILVFGLGNGEDDDNGGW